MLEEAIKDDKRNPAEVALIMLNFVQQQLPAGGTSAENQFFRLYKPLCDRVFGLLITKPKDNKDLYRHKEGGWLSARYPWNRNPSQLQQQSPHHQTIRNAAASIQNASSLIGNAAARGSGKQSSSSSPSPVDVDPVVKFLGGAGRPPSMGALPPTLIETICQESVNRPTWGVELPFLAMPVSCQESWLATLGTTTEASNASSTQHLLSESTRILLTVLLRRGPMEQKELLQYQQLKTQDQQHLSMMKLSPRGFHSPMGVKGTQSESLFSPSSNSNNNNSNKAREQRGEIASPNVVLSMLEYYLFLFLRFPISKPSPSRYPAPQGAPGSSSSSYSTSHYREKEPYGDAVYFSLFRKYLRHFLPYAPEESRSISFLTKYRESQLFLRAIIMMWMETQGKVKTTGAVRNSVEDRQRRSGIRSESIQFDLSSAYDLVSVRYEAPALIIQRGLRQLILHLIMDPHLNERAVREQDWTMTKAMEVFTQPFYNYIRATLRHASLHQENSAFLNALECWLIWLEPWNAKETKTGKARGYYLPRKHEPSRYRSEWERYIAANVHFFATPLAIFLRRARELDFSPNKIEKSMITIGKVFRVYTPTVVDAVSRHLSEASPFSNLVQQHVSLLGPFAPPPGLQTLSSCQGEVKALLEEIQNQCYKRQQEMDWIEKVEKFFFGAVSSENAWIKRTVEEAKVIVGLPASYSPLISAQSPAFVDSQNTQSANIVSADGTLTDAGFQALVTGASKSDPFTIKLAGDPNNARLGSYEVEWIYDLTSLLSQAILEKTGRRVSLRFFADSRILLLLSVVFLIWWCFW